METKLFWIVGAIISGLVAVLFFASRYFDFSDLVSSFFSSETKDENQKQAVEESF